MWKKQLWYKEKNNQVWPTSPFYADSTGESQHGRAVYQKYYFYQSYGEMGVGLQRALDIQHLLFNDTARGRVLPLPHSNMCARGVQNWIVIWVSVQKDNKYSMNRHNGATLCFHTSWCYFLSIKGVCIVSIGLNWSLFPFNLNCKTQHQ